MIGGYTRLVITQYDRWLLSPLGGHSQCSVVAKNVIESKSEKKLPTLISYPYGIAFFLTTMVSLAKRHRSRYPF